MKKYNFCSLIALLVLCVTGAFFNVLPVSAEDTETAISKEEWIHRLVSTFGLSVEQGNVPDNYYPDLLSSDSYYSEMLIGIEYGLIDADAGENIEPGAPATREFAAHTLNYLLGYQKENETYTFSDSAVCVYPDDDQVAVDRGWISLKDGAFNPAEAITEEESAAMLADAESTLAAEVVDTEYENTYELDLSADFVEVPEGTLYEWVDSETLKIFACPVTIAEGEDFVLHMNDIIGVYNAKAVVSEGTITTVTVAKALNSDIVQDIDAQGELDLRNAFIEPAEDTEMYYVNAGTGQTFDTLQKAIDSVSTNAVPNGSVDLSNVKICGEVSRKIGNKGSVKIGFNLANPKLTYDINIYKRTAYVKLTGKMEYYYKVELKGEANIPGIHMFNMVVPGIGGFKVDCKLSAKGSVGGTVAGNLEMGLKKSGNSLRSIYSFKKAKNVISAEGEGSIGLRAAFGINDVPGDVIVADVYLECGAKANVKSVTYNDGKIPNNCTSFKAYLFAEAGYEASVKFGIFSVSDSSDTTLIDENNSPMKVIRHYEDRIPVAKCTRDDGDDGYYTKGSSSYSGSNWSGGDNSYQLDGSGEPYCIFSYTLDDNNNATITKYTGNMRYLTIPETIDGYTVTAIGSSVFNKNTTLYSVTIPSTIRSIGLNAFSNCSNLSWIYLSDGLVTIDRYAFYNCTSLVSVELPDSVTTVDAFAFANCANLSSLKLSKGLQTLNYRAFDNDDRITSVEIPKSLVNSYIGNTYVDGYVGPFANCDGLKTVTFEEGITQIAPNLFASCYGLEEIVIPDTVTSIGSGSFRWAKNLKTVTFSNSLATIDTNAFSECTSLVSVELPDSVKTVDAFAFANCTNLSSLKLSKGLQTMNHRAFSNDDRITSVEIPKSLIHSYIGNTYVDGYVGPFANCDGLKTVTFEEGITQIAPNLFASCYGLEEIVIPDTVTSIGSGSFRWAKNLKTVTFSNSLATIDTNAFSECTSLVSVELPDSVTTVDAFAFANCTNLSSLKLSKGLQTMNHRAFNNDDRITSVEIPKSLSKSNTGTTVGEGYVGPFANCDGLKTVTFEEGTNQIINYLFASCYGLEEIVIPDTVTSIGYDSFAWAKNLKTVTFSNSLTAIGSSAFRDCISLSAALVPDSVTQLGNSIFSNCSSLKEAKLPEGCTGIPKETFALCKSLESFKLPESLTQIGDYAFYNCTALKEVQWNDNLTKIDDYAFKNCDSLTELSLPGKVNILGIQAFYDCDSIVKADFQENLTTISNYAFYSCDALTDLHIPDSVTGMGNNAFAYCKALKNVYLGTGLTYIPSYGFYECSELEEIIIPYRVTQIYSYAFANDPKLVSATILRNVTKIDQTAFSYPLKTTIYGVSGTYAETFANDNGFTFVAIDVPAEQVTLTPNEIKLFKGGSAKLSLKIEPAGFTDAVTWKSSDTNIVTVTDGTIKGVATGTAEVKVYAGNVSASCTVTVVQQVTSISLNSMYVNLEALQSFQFEATVKPSNAWNPSIAWSSSDPAVVTIDENGLAKAVAKGTATITVAAKDGSRVTRTATVNVINNAIVCNSVDELESEHNYPNNSNDFWLYKSDGAEKLSVTFDERTIVENGFDYIYIYDAEGNEIGKYTGTQLAGVTIEIPGDTVKIKLVSDDAGNEWGFKVTDIQAIGAHEHEYGTPEYEWSADNKSVTAKAVCITCADEITETVDTTYEVIKEATETENGLGRYTAVFTNELFETQTKDVEIPAAGHEHEYGTPEYEWSADNKSVTAKVVCITCADEITETVDTTYEVIKEATETEAGTGRYTAEFTNELFETQTKDVEIPAAGHEHEYGTPEYEWSADNKSVTAKVACITCGSEITETVDTTYEIIREATDTESGLGRYTAVFTNELFETQTKDVEIPVIAAGSPESIELDQHSAAVAYNSTIQLVASVLPENANDKTVTWTSSNEAVATVDRNGTVTPKGVGSAVITAETVNGLSDACEIRVLFSDVANSSQYFFVPVYWAVDNGITVGAGGPGKFSPNASCTREQFVTFLWRQQGQPKAEKGCDFTDVPENAWYYEPISWAAEKGITTGLNDGTGRFGVGQSCTREQCVTFLHRAAGTPEPTGSIEFTDSPSGKYYYKAIKWAAGKGITVGLNDGTGRFGVGQKCTRGMLVTFLYRFAMSE